MENILFLVHRIPYPPNKGDKIRSFHFLKALASHFNVYLGTFIDDDEDWQYQSQLSGYCAESLCLPLNPVSAKIKSLTGLIKGQALSLPYYQNKQMQNWVDQVIEARSIKKIVIFSSVMAQFVLGKQNVEIIADFVDVDSDKWRQYARHKHGPEKWIYQRESERLFTFEKQVASVAKGSVFVSQQEADLFKQFLAESPGNVVAVNNGVDVEYFKSELTFESPYGDDEKVVVFTGAMDYWANVDAVVWFAGKLWPKIVQRYPQTKFYIVGSKPTKDVLALAQQKNIVVTGRVEDIRPYLAHATFSVAPLRIARGIQNKVLEAMAMAKTVLATSAAMEGISDYEHQNVVVSDHADTLAEQACRLLSLSTEELRSSENRNFVTNRFSWHASGEQLIRLINS